MFGIGCGVVYFYRAKPRHAFCKLMKEAISECKKANIATKWVTPEELDDITVSPLFTALVLSEFNSELIRKISQEIFRIVGPLCIIECLKKEIQIPDNNSPVFCIAMKDVVVCTTKIPKAKKEDIERLVGYMGGSYSERLTSCVTHLIVDSSKPSEKLAYASKDLKIDIVKSSWVYDCWEKCIDNSYSDDLISKHRLLPFTGLTITLSNLGASLKKTYSKLIENNGGKYDPNLVQNLTSVVVTSQMTGAKVKSAQMWGLPCVTPLWLDECSVIGRPLPYSDYMIHPKVKCSTPTGSDTPSFIGSEDVSVVQSNSSIRAVVDETHDISFASTVSSVYKQIPLEPLKMNLPAAGNSVSQTSQRSSSDIALPDCLNVAEIMKAGLFLDGCKIFIIGWKEKEKEKLSHLLIKSGAIVLDKQSDRVSHIVAANKEAVTTLDRHSSAKCVSLDWVIASMKERKAVNMDAYMFTLEPGSSGRVNKAVPPSPLSSKGLELLKSGKNVTNDVTRHEENQENQPLPVENRFASPQVSRKLFSFTPKAPAKREFSRYQDTPGTEGTSMGDTESSTITGTTLFQGLVITVLGFDDSSTVLTSQVIESCGGTLARANYSGVVDYAIVPIEGVYTRVSALEVVNPLWVDDCREQNKILDIAYYHRPVPVISETRLNGCVVCLSGFVGKERFFLSNLAAQLSAVVQDSFSRRDIPKKGVVKSTHLIAFEASGSKYDAAMKWSVPVVSARWLLDAAGSAAHPISAPPPESEYPVKDDPSNIEDDDGADTPIGVTPAAVRKINPNTVEHSDQASKEVDEPTATRCSEEASSRIPVEIAPGLTPNELRNKSLPLEPGNVSLRKRVLEGSASFLTPGQESVSGKTPGSKGSIGSASGSGGLGSCSIASMPTPDTPYGAAFHDDPSPNTRKRWKKYIDNYPSLTPDVSPADRKRRNSTPLSVIKKQILAKIGGEVEGIEKDSGKLLKNGPYGQWARDSIGSNSGSVKVTSVETTPVTRKSDDTEAATKSGSKAVNELLSLMSEIKRTNNEEATVDATENVNELALRLSKKPDAEKSFSANHPLNKLRPNMQLEFEAERPTGEYGHSEEPVAGDELSQSSSMSRPSNSSIASRISNLSTSQGAILDGMRDGFTQDLGAEEAKVSNDTNQNKLFVLSNLSPEAKIKYEGIVMGLGARVSTSSIYEDEMTHLIIDLPRRNEKLLCAIAAGKWILHYTYLDMCYESRKFLDEEDYEFGNSRSECRLPKPEAGTQAELASAAYWWRKKVNTISQRAFRQLNVALYVRGTSEPMFIRLLKAGGATIVKNPLKANLVLLEENKVDLPSEFSSLVQKRIPVVPPVYLFVFISKYANVNPFDHVISAYTKK